MWCTNVCRIAISLLALATSGTLLAADKAGTEQQLSVSDSRPVAKAVEVLSQRHDIVITYEDPAYAFEGDLKDVAADVSRSSLKAGQRTLIPRESAIQLSYSLSTSTGNLESPDALVRKVLDTYVANGGGSQFELIQQDDVLHVVPVMVKNSAGVWVATRSALDTPITVPVQRRSGLQMVNVICSALSAAAKVSAMIGMVPTSALANDQVVEGGTNEPARDILSRSLKQLLKERKYVWQLLFDPSSKMYFLNLSLLPPAQVVTQRPKEEQPDRAAPNPDTSKPR